MRTYFLLFLMLIISTTVLAADTPTHTVRPGETLFSISRQYEITVEQLRTWNNLPDNVIRVGQELIVGSGARPASQDRDATTRTTTRSDVPQDTRTDAHPDRRSGERTITHTVEPGQTLFRISQIYDVTVDEIKQWNNLRDNIISIGQELEIRRHHVADRAEPDAPQEEPTVETERPDETQPPDLPREPVTQRQTELPDEDEFGAPDAPSHYEVRPGDTLYRIASQFNMTTQELMDYNDLDTSTIHVGQRLRIRSRPAAPPSVAAEWEMESTAQGRFVTHTINKGDSLHQLLKHHQMDMDEFRALNPGTSASDLREGDEITLILAAATTRRNPYRTGSREDNGSQIQVTRYPEDRHRKTTTSGDLYNPEALTAAHPSLSLGTVVYVENPENGRGIFVHVNDRTPENRLMLSDAAFRSLGYYNATQLTAKIHEVNDN